ncbi:MAG: hypothetical protein J1F23_00765 [Oscillospiraceae bacterium]|nr:hypothetical protein [Oscillospiraceae bacterium]
MKKVISIAVALLMVVLAVVPAFAAEGDPTLDAKTTSGESTILTKETTADGEDGATFTVTYPASTEFDWNALVGKANVDYSATTHLKFGHTLTVNVASDTNKMVLADDAQYALEYTLKDDAAGTTALQDLVLGAVAEGAKTVYVDIPQAQWDAAPVGTYSDILTFTATVNG